MNTHKNKKKELKQNTYWDAFLQKQKAEEIGQYAEYAGVNGEINVLPYKDLKIPTIPMLQENYIDAEEF